MVYFVYEITKYTIKYHIQHYKYKIQRSKYNNVGFDSQNTKIRWKLNNREQNWRKVLMHTHCQHCRKDFQKIRALKTHFEEDNCQRETSSDEDPDVTFPSQKSSDSGNSSLRHDNEVGVYL